MTDLENALLLYQSTVAPWSFQLALVIAVAGAWVLHQRARRTRSAIFFWLLVLTAVVPILSSLDSSFSFGGGGTDFFVALFVMLFLSVLLWPLLALCFLAAALSLPKLGKPASESAKDE